MALVARISSSRGPSDERFRNPYKNGSNPASLILGKVYRRLPDEEAETHQMLRVVDEDTSETDGYLYPDQSSAIELPEEVQRALMAASG